MVFFSSGRGIRQGDPMSPTYLPLLWRCLQEFLICKLATPRSNISGGASRLDFPTYSLPMMFYFLRKRLHLL